mmetsp:Transcript_31129/g.51412  ORF Transcript_31129/g.51412 Transcript_31129/m.51412 type:complete len:238 (-) Transcript_31129:520-1233(-)
MMMISCYFLRTLSFRDVASWWRSSAASINNSNLMIRIYRVCHVSQRGRQKVLMVTSKVEHVLESKVTIVVHLFGIHVQTERRCSDARVLHHDLIFSNKVPSFNKHVHRDLQFSVILGPRIVIGDGLRARMKEIAPLFGVQPQIGTDSYGMVCHLKECVTRNQFRISHDIVVFVPIIRVVPKATNIAPKENIGLERVESNGLLNPPCLAEPNPKHVKILMPLFFPIEFELILPKGERK